MWGKDYISNQNIVIQALILVGLMCGGGLLAGILSLATCKLLFGYGIMDVAAGGMTPAMAPALKWLQGLQGVFLFIVPALVFLFLKNKSIGQIFKPKKSFSTYVAGFYIMLVAAPLVGWLFLINQNMHLPAAMQGIEAWMRTAEAQAAEATKIFTAANSIGVLLINILVIAILPGLGEELIFRGVLQNIFKEKLYNKHIAIFLTGIIFSAIHVQFLGFLPRALMGIVLGYLYEYSGSLTISIIAHCTNNALAAIAAYLYQNQMTNNDLGEFADYPLWSVVVSTILVVGCLWSVKRNNQAIYAA